MNAFDTQFNGILTRRYRVKIFTYVRKYSYKPIAISELAPFEMLLAIRPATIDTLIYYYSY